MLTVGNQLQLIVPKKFTWTGLGHGPKSQDFYACRLGHGPNAKLLFLCVEYDIQATLDIYNYLF